VDNGNSIPPRVEPGDSTESNHLDQQVKIQKGQWEWRHGRFGPLQGKRTITSDYKPRGESKLVNMESGVCACQTEIMRQQPGRLFCWRKTIPRIPTIRRRANRLCPCTAPRGWQEGRCLGKAAGPGAARGSPAAGPTSGRVREGQGRRMGRPGEAQEGICSCSPPSRVRRGFGARILPTSVSLRPPLGPSLSRPPPQPRETRRSHFAAPDSTPLNAETSPALHQPHKFLGRIEIIPQTPNQGSAQLISPITSAHRHASSPELSKVNITDTLSEQTSRRYARRHGGASSTPTVHTTHAGCISVPVWPENHHRGLGAV
jgi:hypothetical protein